MKTNLRLHCAAVSLLVACTPAFAGGWVSGGGELLKDANNPWFLSNTTDVSYCIEVDTAHFSVDPARLPEFIEAELAYWKREFALSSSPFDAPDVEIATQTFHREACAPTTDVRFQFGTLAPEQRERIDPRRFVGLSIRTDYDLRHLRAKGFIYVAADSGPDLPEYPGVEPAFWSSRADWKSAAMPVAFSSTSATSSVRKPFSTSSSGLPETPRRSAFPGSGANVLRTRAPRRPMATIFSLKKTAAGVRPATSNAAAAAAAASNASKSGYRPSRPSFPASARPMSTCRAAGRMTRASLSTTPSTAGRPASCA